MTQPPFHISYLAMVLFGLSQMLDSGKHDEITLDEVKEHARSGDLIKFLEKRNGGSFAMGVHKSNNDFAAWYQRKILDNIDAMDSRERRKYAIKNRGLCLLISYTAEIIQQGDDITLER